MPLSDHEQQILAELEESLSKEDPRFAKNVSETNVYSFSGRRVKLGIVGFILGLLLLVSCFAFSIILGLIGVALMFASAIMVERNARRLSKATWQDVTRKTKHVDDSTVVGPRVASLRKWLNSRRFPTS
jgi:hypothetical protein